MLTRKRKRAEASSQPPQPEDPKEPEDPEVPEVDIIALIKKLSKTRSNLSEDQFAALEAGINDVEDSQLALLNPPMERAQLDLLLAQGLSSRDWNGSRLSQFRIFPLKPSCCGAIIGTASQDAGPILRGVQDLADTMYPGIYQVHPKPILFIDQKNKAAHEGIEYEPFSTFARFINTGPQGCVITIALVVLWESSPVGKHFVEWMGEDMHANIVFLIHPLRAEEKLW
ncbi:hypothetical protein R3P38DRAFT_3425675 [Favolaschia claudopus]|uniref:Uncharacterized protein n=1 Tax=Favolaschia claudopus TaxID=2862362 RepID=A0AAV9ZWF5_9AGAR